MGYAAGQWSASRGVAAWAAEEWGRHEPAALIQAGIALARFDSTPWLSQVDVPTAVLVTERDSTVPPALQKSLAKRIPGSLTFAVDGDHRVVGDAPDRFVPVLLKACDAVGQVRVRD
jgi:3-oxoadipate enol-lactonase